ncbi:hypothetical protein AYR62_09165 [Secundilactobacillus paracollinoides]|uniref:DUF3923 domain-containing protein n=1 Tax=Secundilactobacillus paracollinoides TaxID=240427 RepID=A0A1B2IZ21_9LACO|nr:hypothetical protein [Secundilactobacillus paracollinoides]ANZ61381.1 hypothetical protein AYR61_08455 [Secundilactobacillus paracollinoides]ANZ64226.1 hypothetical protein AYR62_09165 [Secundilactobacillus paracollinoides]ANZ67301.1 hypothetical protein AYR63_09200 [Secundilactobacillus paracollinoides]KRL78191.1 hypothetical protein FC17_GL001072 [Secundilactobacillus paracollinoides DSM 15502 = JCM 11969]
MNNRNWWLLNGLGVIVYLIGTLWLMLRPIKDMRALLIPEHRMQTVIIWSVIAFVVFLIELIVLLVKRHGLKKRVSES